MDILFRHPLPCPPPSRGRESILTLSPGGRGLGRGGTIYVYTILKPFKIRGGKVGL